MPFIYSLLFVVSIRSFKQYTSLSVIVVLLALFEFASNAVTLPLLNALNDKSITYFYRLSAWVGFWILVDAAIIQTLQKAHVWLNVSKGKELVIVQWAYTVLICLLTMYYLNALSLNSEIIARIPQIGIPIINLSLAGYLLFVAIKKLELTPWKAQA
ncbi:hypothetical protein [Alteromonas sp. a30]|uniref:hypothetical protein n=1 Tax=Alteromonas sp. a30 TaxID=2730917 RepID=UPI002280229F|nr:hypothetical protein [Alteromonas sp. a30]MCY7295049.1 hypothetical protein [Alteromonas sp. a30]